MEYNLTNLVSTLKVQVDNIQTLHRNLYGPNFKAAHEQLGEYYNYVFDFLDYCAELLVSEDKKEPNLATALEICQAITVRERNEVESLKIVSEYFEEYINMIESVKKDQPSYVASKLEEFQEYFRLQAHYIIKRRIMNE